MNSIARRPRARRTAVRSLAALAAVHCPFPASAQDEAANRSQHIVVTGERAHEPDPAAASAAEIARIPGGAELVPGSAFENSPVQHIRDVLAQVPGVVTQPRMGDDARVSIRGSGLSRAYGTRGIALLLDGMPLNTSDGLVDFFEIDPSAYARVEVYKGANALRYGANALGGAINLVTPTGREAELFDGRFDAGGYGYMKGQASTGGAAGAADWFVTVSGQRNEGYRAHSHGSALRGNANLGYRLSPAAETRFYLTATRTRQRIPGEVSKRQALETPRAANPEWIAQDQARDVDSLRVANKTTLRFGPTTLELGGFHNGRRVKHPIYQWLDISVSDYGLFARALDDRFVGGLRNRLIAGLNLHNGTIETEQFENIGGDKGALLASMADRSANLSAYAEDSLFVRHDLALVAGLQFLYARRERTDRFHANGDQSGLRRFSLWSPKLGLLWDAGPQWQVFANASRSAEVPSYDTNSFASAASSELEAQRATTFEVGTRGRRGGAQWSLSLYRAQVRNELQCLTTAPWALCSAINVDRTMHQGIEAGLEFDLTGSLLTAGDNVRLSAAYTYNDFRFRNDPLYGDNRLPGVPEHQLRTELLYRHPAGFYAGPSFEWVAAAYFADNANSLSVDPFALVNLRLGHDLGSGLSGYFEARNLFAKRYISTVAIAGSADEASELFNPGTGRAAFAGVRWRW